MTFNNRIKDNITQAYLRRDLLKQMIVSKLIVGQKEFMLGYLWWILEPLLSTIIYWLLFHIIFQRGGPDYHIFILCGLIPFKAISSSTNQSLNALRGNLPLLSQLSFPRIFLPVSNILVNHVKLIFGFLIIFIAAVLYYRSVSVNILWFIVPFFFQIVMLCGIAMIFSILGVYFTDLLNIVELLTRGFLFLSPIFYSVERIPVKYRDIYILLNPVAPLILSYRDIFLNGVAPKTEYLIILFIYSFLIISIGYLFFCLHERKILKCL